MIAQLLAPSTAALDALRSEARRLHDLYAEQSRHCPCAFRSRLCRPCQQALDAADSVGLAVRRVEGW